MGGRRRFGSNPTWRAVSDRSRNTWFRIVRSVRPYRPTWTAHGEASKPWTCRIRKAPRNRPRASKPNRRDSRRLRHAPNHAHRSYRRRRQVTRRNPPRIRPPPWSPTRSNTRRAIRVRGQYACRLGLQWFHPIRVRAVRHPIAAPSGMQATVGTPVTDPQPGDLMANAGMRAFTSATV